MKIIIKVIFAVFTISATYAQVGINADNSAPHASAQLDVKSTTKAFYPPRMTTAQKNAIASPQAGAVVFDNTLNRLSFYNGTSWVAAAGGGLTLPYDQSQSFTSETGGLFKITNIANTVNANAIWGETNGGGSGIRGINNSLTSVGTGIFGIHYGGGEGVYALSESGIGVFGSSVSGVGVKGSSSEGPGGWFSSYSGYALITDKGNVGIGTLTPSAKMDIKGSAYLSHFYFGTNEDTYIRGGKAGSHVIINDYTDQGNVGIGLSNPAYILDVKKRIRIRHTVDGTPDDNTAGIWYNNSANVEGAFSGMKTDTEVGLFLGGNWRFWVNSDGQGYLNGALIQTSDKRLKKDFMPLNNSLSDIYKINGYHFKWIEEARNKELQTGFIAQEVQKIFPELVQTDEKGFLSVNYIGLIPHLLEAVKELKNENNSLKTENNSFKNNQTKLESRMDKMETLLNSFSKNTASN